MRDIEHGLVSVSNLYDGCLTVELTSRKFVLKKQNCVVGVSKRVGRMYFVSLQRASD